MQPYCPVVQVHCFAQKVDAYCRLVRVIKRVIHEAGVRQEGSDTEPAQHRDRVVRNGYDESKLILSTVIINNKPHRVMREVLPTDWSPRSTILVRFSPWVEVKSAVVGVPEFDMTEKIVL